MTYQLTAPLLDACVLGIVMQEDVYGYTLTQKVQQVVDVSESTLYPVLRRLQKSGYLTTYDVPYQGRNRRYYSITKEGMILLKFYRDEWHEYRSRIDSMIENQAGSLKDGMADSRADSIEADMTKSDTGSLEEVMANISTDSVMDGSTYSKTEEGGEK